MKPLRSLLTGLLGVLALAFPAFSAELGDPAAPLQIAEWVKGKPVDLAGGKGKKIFVVEFWATWCGPCRASIPHLTELQKKFKDKDVVFIGVSDEDVPTVKKFVEKMGDKMDYTVAVDTDRKTSKGYMTAYGQGGIPTAFIVDKEGRMVWFGHPMGDLEKSLEQVVAGKFDLEKAKQRETTQKKINEFYTLARKDAGDAKLDELAKEIQALEMEPGDTQSGRKFDPAEVRKSVKFQKAVGDYQRALLAGKDDGETEKLGKQVEEAAPPTFKLADYKESILLRKTFSDYYAAASGKTGAAKLGELGLKLLDAKTKNAITLNEWAWTILTDEKIKTRDLKLATKLAKAALDASEGKDSNILDTYARALFDSGRVSEAITTQKKAIELAENDEARQPLEETLKGYQAKLAAK
jgi:thiol-disulfide isomerase/thioredoxin